MSGEARMTHVSIDGSGAPHDRDWFAQYIRARLMGNATDAERSVYLTSEEGAAIAFLLDELAAIYKDEDLGEVARLASERIAASVYRVRRDE